MPQDPQNVDPPKELEYEIATGDSLDGLTAGKFNFTVNDSNAVAFGTSSPVAYTIVPLDAGIQDYITWAKNEPGVRDQLELRLQLERDLNNLLIRVYSINEGKYISILVYGGNNVLALFEYTDDHQGLITEVCEAWEEKYGTCD